MQFQHVQRDAPRRNPAIVRSANPEQANPEHANPGPANPDLTNLGPANPYLSNPGLAHSERRAVWECCFLEADLKTPLPRRVCLKDRQEVSALARRGGCDTNLIVQQPFEDALRKGRGGIWLELNVEQYNRLK
jgi:hypothetical protein